MCAEVTSYSHSSYENDIEGYTTLKGLKTFVGTRVIRSGRHADPSTGTKAYRNWNCDRNTARNLLMLE